VDDDEWDDEVPGVVCAADFVVGHVDETLDICVASHIEAEWLTTNLGDFVAIGVVKLVGLVDAVVHQPVVAGRRNRTGLEARCAIWVLGCFLRYGTNGAGEQHGAQCQDKKWPRQQHRREESWAMSRNRDRSRGSLTPALCQSRIMQVLSWHTP